MITASIAFGERRCAYGRCLFTWFLCRRRFLTAYWAMYMKRLLIVGAAGDVGKGITAVAVENGMQVIAAGRNEKKLQDLQSDHNEIAIVRGDLGTEAGAEQLWASAVECYGGIDAVVISVNAPIKGKALFSRSSDEVLALWQADVISHFVAAKTFIPKLAEDGIYIGIGGGMADFIMPTMGTGSMAQASLRNMYKMIVKEAVAPVANIRELMILSMVNGESRRDDALPTWITDLDIGKHVCAIINHPECFPQPILQLKSREQAGQPDQI